MHYLGWHDEVGWLLVGFTMVWRLYAMCSDSPWVSLYVNDGYRLSTMVQTFWQNSDYLLYVI